MIATSKLGFGLSSIAGSGNFAHQERLVRTAIDHGITHFDVAPYYGSGDAESILGRILSKCPEQVTITTKFGLVPFAGGRGGSLLRAALRPVFRQLGFLKRLASAAIKQNHTPSPVSFQQGNLLKSIEESTARIGRPIDILLLHDPTYDFARDKTLLAELVSLKEAGLVKETGISGEAEVVAACTLLYPEIYSVAQLENSLTCPAPIEELTANARKIITHRAIQGGLEYLIFLLEKHPTFRSIWLQETSLEIGSREELARLLVQVALVENQGGTVLFSSTSPDRVIRTAQAIDGNKINQYTALTIRELFKNANTLTPASLTLKK